MSELDKTASRMSRRVFMNGSVAMAAAVAESSIPMRAVAFNADTNRGAQGRLVQTPVLFDPLTADRSAWRRFHELRRVRREDLRPEDPLQPDDLVEANMKKPDPFALCLYYEISRRGVIYSNYRGQTVRPQSPEYATNKHIFSADAYVRPGERRQGLGSLWLRLTAELMNQHGCTMLSMGAEQGDGHSFMRWLGAEPKLTNIESRLDLSTLDWTMVERWVKEGQERSPQTRLEIYDRQLPPEMLDDFAVQRTALLDTMPMEGLEIGDIIVTPEMIREWLERAEISGIVWHNVLTRDADGTISGMTDVEWAPYSRSQIQQRFTGVLPAARGRGIGKWIKAAMLLHLRELYPDAKFFITNNARSNAPMLKINRDLGFKAFRTYVEYQISREALESKIRTL